MVDISIAILVALGVIGISFFMGMLFGASTEQRRLKQLAEQLQESSKSLDNAVKANQPKEK